MWITICGVHTAETVKAEFFFRMCQKHVINLLVALYSSTLQEIGMSMQGFMVRHIKTRWRARFH